MDYWPNTSIHTHHQMWLMIMFLYSHSAWWSLAVHFLRYIKLFAYSWIEHIQTASSWHRFTLELSLVLECSVWRKLWNIELIRRFSISNIDQIDSRISCNWEISIILWHWSVNGNKMRVFGLLENSKSKHLSVIDQTMRILECFIQDLFIFSDNHDEGLIMDHFIDT